MAVVIATAIPVALLLGDDDDETNNNNNNNAGSPADDSQPSLSTSNSPTRTPAQPTVYNDDANNNNNNTPTLSPTTNYSPPVTTARTCNGLANLCDMPVNEILFATMHNANSVAGSVLVFPNHNKDLVTALQAGIRGLNMDIGICDGEVVLVHGLCLAGFSELVPAFTNIVQFLVDNPNEVVIMPIQINDDDDDDDTGGGVVIDLATLYSTLQQDVVVGTTSMADLLYAHPGPETTTTTTTTTTTPWPTLGELIDNNKRILFFRYNSAQNCVNTVCPTGFHDWFAYAVETAFEFDTVADIIDDTTRSCQITRGSAGTRDFFGINMFAQIASEEISAQLNTREVLLQHLETCSALNGNMRPNLLLVDFWDTGDVVETVQEYNAGLSRE